MSLDPTTWTWLPFFRSPGVFLLRVLIVSTLFSAATLILLSLLQKRSSAALREIIARYMMFALWIVLWLAMIQKQIALPLLPSQASEEESVSATNIRDSGVARPVKTPPAASTSFPLKMAVPTWASSSRLTHILAGIWLLGFLVGLGKITLGKFALARICRRAQAVDDPGILQAFQAAYARLSCWKDFRLIQSNKIQIPVTWGYDPAIIALPNHVGEWPEKTLQAALLHEIAHVMRADSGLNSWNRLVCAAYWFNPLVHRLASVWRREAEQACDDQVLQTGYNGPEYGKILLGVWKEATSQRAFVDGLAMVHASTLELRITSLLDGRRKRGEVGFWKRTMLASVFFPVVIACGLLWITRNSGLERFGERFSGAIQVLDNSSISNPQAQVPPLKVSPSGEEVFAGVCWRYSSCGFFSCTGIYQSKMDANLMRELDHRAFSIRYSRPNRIRVSWTERWPSFPPTSENEIISTIYTESGHVKTFSPILSAGAYSSIANAIGTEAGVSRGITYLIPSLLLGKTGYLDHWKIERLADERIAGDDCFVIALETKGFGNYLLNVRKRDNAIIRSIDVSKADVVDAQRQRAHRENPHWFNDLGGPMKTYISTTTVMEFKDVVFDQTLDDFAYSKAGVKE